MLAVEVPFLAGENSLPCPAVCMVKIRLSLCIKITQSKPREGLNPIENMW